MALVLVLGAAVYALAGSAGCSGGTVTLDVAAAPSVVPAVVAAARRFDDSGHEVGGACARARVRTAEPAAVATLLSGEGVAGVTRKPDVWISDSSLWPALVEGSPQAAGGPLTGLGPMASSPVVAAVPRGLAARLPARTSWLDLFGAGGTLPERSVRPQVPDPDRTATGMAALLVARSLQERAPDGEAAFTGVVRAIREGIAPSVGAQFAAFRPGERGREPVAVASEQAVFAFDARRPAEPAVAVYPAEGTLFLDHPVMLVGRDPAKARAARLLQRELTSATTRDALRGLGFRTPDGAAPAAFAASAARTGLAARAPRALPAPAAGDVRRTMQEWARLSLGIRMLSIIDVSGSMAAEVAPGVTRLQSTIRAAQGGLSLLPDDSELGQWVFSTRLDGRRDWREVVAVGPLGQRVGSATRRQLVLTSFAQMRAVEGGRTGLYDTVRDAYAYMKRTYKPEFVNSVVLWTDGRNDDPDGPSLEATLETLEAEYDPERPVKVFMLGYGDGVDVGELQRIAKAAQGAAFVAETPDAVQRFFLQAVARRICTGDC